MWLLWKAAQMGHMCPKHRAHSLQAHAQKKMHIASQSMVTWHDARSICRHRQYHEHRPRSAINPTQGPLPANEHRQEQVQHASCPQPKHSASQRPQKKEQGTEGARPCESSAPGAIEGAGDRGGKAL